MWKLRDIYDNRQTLCILATLAKWLLEFLGVPRIFLRIPRNKGVNFHSKFGLGISNHNNSGSKNLEIPTNSQKFQVYNQQDLKFLGIPRNSNEFQLREPMTFPEKL